MQKTSPKNLVIRALQLLRSWLLSSVAGMLGAGLWGCAQSEPSNDAQKERNPYYQKAKELYVLSDYQGAAGFYEKALVVDPQSAPAHLELGLLYDEKLGDPIEAIHHYRQYLALRPDSYKRSLVQDFIERAKLSLAAKLPQATGVDPNMVARLRSENARLLQEDFALKAKVTELETAVAALPHPVQDPVATVAPSVMATRLATASPVARGGMLETSKSRTHVVQKGDTLQSLAFKYYGTRSAWDKIYQANRDVLPSKDQLRIGQQLNLP